MASITFKAKAHPLPDGRYLIQVPQLVRRHCDMAAFRAHPKFGGIANSDLFPNALSRIKRDLFGDSGCLFSNRIPACVTVNTTGFLYEVTISA